MTNSEPTIVEATQFPPPDSETNPPMRSQVLGEAGGKEDDTENIYLDLDTILDTVMGTLAKMGTEHAVAALNSGRYHKRMIDEFDNITKEQFREEYNKRDIETLKMSVLTNLVYFLRRLVKDSLISSIIHQRVEKMCFTVNVYPYNFDDPGLVEMLIACIRFHTYSTSSVRIVSIPPEELTPEYCAQNFQIMIKYDWINWVDKHKPFFEKKGIPGVTVVVPEIFYEAVPTTEDIDRLDMKKKNPFRMTEEIVAPLFRLKHMPISLFSINEKITKESAAEIVQRVQVTEADIMDYLDKAYPKADLVRDNPLPNVDLSHAYDLI
jgi:hypothetical protein